MKDSGAPAWINQWIATMYKAGWYISLYGDCFMYHADEDAKISHVEARALCVHFISTGEIPTPYNYRTILGEVPV